MKSKKIISLLAGILIFGSMASGTSLSVKAMTPLDAISKIAPLVVKYDDKGGMLPSVKIAQVLLESGNLTSELAVNANNPVGMKFSAPFSNLYPEAFYYKNSGEYGSSGAYSKISAFRKYDTLEDAIKDHAGFFTSSQFRTDLYAKALNAQNYKDQANALTGTYATSMDYGQKLIGIIEKYGLTKYDGNNGSTVSNGTVTTVPKSTSPKETVVSSGEIYLSASTAVYGNANDAARKVNSTKSYPAGKYFIYKTANGAVNISRTAGIPGGWISSNDVSSSAPVATKPSVPSVPVVETAKASSPVVTENGKITISSTVTVYANADNAARGMNPVKTYPAGVYYIYKETSGAVNISRSYGTPGAWISKSVNTTGTVTTPVTTAKKPVLSIPNTETGTSAKPSTTAAKEGNYVLRSAVSVYGNASDASKGVNAVSTYPAGTYYIYKESGSAINISRREGTPGAWINTVNNLSETKTSAMVTEKTSSFNVTNVPEIEKVTETSVAETETNDCDFTLSSPAEVYGTSQDAIKGSNPVKVYPAGNYYIYKSVNGAVNISTQKGAPGAWIKNN